VSKIGTISIDTPFTLADYFGLQFHVKRAGLGAKHCTWQTKTYIRAFTSSEHLEAFLMARTVSE
jgi:hypothetical protein